MYTNNYRFEIEHYKDSYYQLCPDYWLSVCEHSDGNHTDIELHLEDLDADINMCDFEKVLDMMELFWQQKNWHSQPRSGKFYYVSIEVYTNTFPRASVSMDVNSCDRNKIRECFEHTLELFSIHVARRFSSNDYNNVSVSEYDYDISCDDDEGGDF